MPLKGQVVHGVLAALIPDLLLPLRNTSQVSYVAVAGKHTEVGFNPSFLTGPWTHLMRKITVSHEHKPCEIQNETEKTNRLVPALQDTTLQQPQKSHFTTTTDISSDCVLCRPQTLTVKYSKVITNLMHVKQL